MGWLFCGGLLLGAFTPLDRQPYKVRTVVIDAGHGGRDPGTRGSRSYERDVALKVALELGAIIEKNLPDVRVIYTRKANAFIPLDERAAIANRAQADLFISIHCNSGARHVHGTETYTMGLHTSEGNLEVAKRENAAILKEDNYLEKYEGFNPTSPLAHILFANVQHVHLDNSLRFAGHVEDQFRARVGRHSRGVKQAGFLVLWKTSMPSALIEIGFLTHPEEEKYLTDGLGQTYIASGIYRAFRDYKAEIEALE